MFSNIISNLIVATQTRRQEGQAMVEYGLIIALVSVGLVTVLGATGLGGDLLAVFTSINTALAAA